MEKISKQGVQSKLNLIPFDSDDSVVYQTLKEYQSNQNVTRQLTPKETPRHKRQISKYFSQYSQYFKQLQQKADKHIQQCLANTQSLQEHKIIIINQKGCDNKLISFTTPFIVIVDQQFQGTIIKYQIVIANFKLQFKLLNVKEQAPKQLQKIGEGGFGQIYRINYGQSIRMIAKRIIFKHHSEIIDDDQICWITKPNKRQIEDVLCQYAMYKICSFLKIGPKIKSASGFQLICYSNCLQFYMEECNKMNEVTKKLNFVDVSQRVKLCIRILHKMKIIHKDVKPDNILFSHRYDNFVLTDFGVSHSIYQQLGSLTYSYQDGTSKYMCPQMLAIPKNQRRYIDLYYNDLYALKLTLNKLILKKPFGGKKVKEVELNEFYISIKMFMLFSNYKLEQAFEKMLQFIPLINDELIFLRLVEIGKQNIKKLINLNNNKLSKYQSEEQKLKIVQRLKNILDQLAQRIQQIQQGQNKIAFLIRVYGFDYFLLQFTEKIKDKKKREKLSQKIKNLRKFKHNYEDIEKLNIIGHFKKVQKILQIEMNKYEVLVNESKNKKNNKKLIRIMSELFFMKITQKSKNFLQDCTQLLKKIRNLDGSEQYQGLTRIYQKIIEYIKVDGVTLKITQQQLQKLEYFDKQQQITQNYQKIIKILFSIKLLDEIIVIAKKYVTLKSFQKRSIKLAEMYNYIGNCYYYKCQIVKALQYYEKSIQNLAQYQNYKLYNSYLNNLGNCFFKLGNYEKAIIYYQKDLNLQIQKIGQCHPDTAVSLNNLGNCYLYKKNYQKAFQYLENSLNIKLVTIGQQHPDTAFTFVNLGSYYTQIHQYQKAKAYLYKGLRILIESGGQKDHATALTFSNLAKLFEYQNQFQKAIKFSFQSLRINEYIFGKMSIQNINCYSRLGNCYLKLKKFKKCIKNFKIILQILKNKIGQSGDLQCYIQYLKYTGDMLIRCYLIKQRYWQLIYLIEKIAKYCLNFKSQIVLNQLSYCYIQLAKKSKKQIAQKKSLWYKIQQLTYCKYDSKEFKYLFELTSFYYKSKKQQQCLILEKYIKQIIELTQNKQNQQKLKRLYRKIINLNKQKYAIHKKYYGNKPKKQQQKLNTLIIDITYLKKILYKSRNLKIHGQIHPKLTNIIESIKTKIHGFN